MRSLWFVVPVHGRLPLAAICLRQLKRTCDDLRREEGIAATAVVVTEQNELYELRRLMGGWPGFGWVFRDNSYLSRRFNDGIQLATDPRFNPHPADVVVPFGSDDWADYRIFVPDPGPSTVIGYQRMSFVREDGAEITTSFLRYEGGAGIRLIPRELLAALDYRPADEDRKRGCDTSILRNLRFCHGDRLQVDHYHLHDHQIVDWKTPEANLNIYSAVSQYRQTPAGLDPFAELAGVYPEEALAAMRDYYESIGPVRRVA